MSNVSAFGNISGGGAGPVIANADQVLKKSSSAGMENFKIEKSAKDFESILLGSWLQQAEQSFGSVPGGDGNEDADPGKEQFQGMAMQQLGSAMTASGGIGIAKMISSQLHKAQDAEAAAAVKLHPPHKE
jgi:Rod binding domain-containing protein